MLELDHRLAPDTPASLSTNQSAASSRPSRFLRTRDPKRSGNLPLAFSALLWFTGTEEWPSARLWQTHGSARAHGVRTEDSLSKPRLSGCCNFGMSLEWDIWFFASLLFLKNTPCVFLFLPCFLNISLTHFPPDIIPPLSSHPDLSHYASAPSRFGRILAPVIQKQLLHGAHSVCRKMSLSWLLSTPAKLTTLGPGLSLRVCEQRRGNWDGCHGGGGPTWAPKSAPVEPDSGTLGMDCSLVLSRHFPGATTWRFPVLTQRLSDSDWMELLR